MIEVRKLNLDNTRRIIVTSDVHANLNLFKKLLDKVRFSPDDYLFINGDLCEKGRNSLELVDYVRKMKRTNPNVHITKGNCDVVHQYVMDGNEGILPYIKGRKHSVLNEMMAQYGKVLDDFVNLQALADFYRANFQETLDFLESLPEAYELDDYIIIHAGIDIVEDWYQTDKQKALYTEAFYEKDHQSEKNVIVGHWPVVNYRSNTVSSHNPIIDLQKRIISIDGGNQIKSDGQLNALIIEDGQCSFCYVDELDQEIMIKRDYMDSLHRVGTVTYPNYEVEVIQQEQYFTKCKNINLGTIQWIKSEYIKEKEGRFYCGMDVSVTFLPVKSGETVKIIDDQCEGYALVKKYNGEVGWIPKDCL